VTLTEIVWLVVRKSEGVTLSQYGAWVAAINEVGEGELMVSDCGAGTVPPCSPVNEKNEGLMVRRLGTGTVDSTSFAMLLLMDSVNHMLPSFPEVMPAGDELPLGVKY
jgi:hypothetical protein